MADQLREELKTPEACDRLIETICIAAGRTEHDHRDLVQWAAAEGDEGAAVLAHRIIRRQREAVNRSLADLKRWKARLEAEAQQRADQ
jgi:hypothetical protein